MHSVALPKVFLPWDWPCGENASVLLKGQHPHSRPPASCWQATLCTGRLTSTWILQLRSCSFAQSHIMCPAPGCLNRVIWMLLSFNWLTATPLVSCYSPCCPYLVCLEIGPGFEISDSVPGTAPCVFSWCAWLSAMARVFSLVLTANNGNASSSPPPPTLINLLVSW